MSFGFSIGDAIQLTQLAWKTVQNAQKACGEHDELTQEVLGLHLVIRRLEQEVRKPTCPINRDHDTYEEELEVLVQGCKKNLNVLDQVLTKYNALSDQERSGKRLWQKIRFGNGKVSDMAELRARLTYYTSAMSLFLNMVSLGTMGRVERQLNDAGGDLKEIKVSVNEIIAKLMSKSQGREGSILTAYADDDRAVWKEFRRELVHDGFSSSIIRKHKRLIKSYIEELGSRGLLDDVNPDNVAEERDLNDIPVVESVLSPDSDTQKKIVPLTTPQGEDKSTIKLKLLLVFDPWPDTAKSGDEELQSKSMADSLSLLSIDKWFETFKNDLNDIAGVWKRPIFMDVQNDDLSRLFKSNFKYAAHPKCLQTMIDEFAISTVESMTDSEADVLAYPIIVSRDDLCKRFASYFKTEAELGDQRSLNDNTVWNAKSQTKSTADSPLVFLPILPGGSSRLQKNLLMFVADWGFPVSRIDNTVKFPSQVVLDQVIEIAKNRLILRYIVGWIRDNYSNYEARLRDGQRTPWRQKTMDRMWTFVLTGSHEL